MDRDGGPRCEARASAYIASALLSLARCRAGFHAKRDMNVVTCVNREQGHHERSVRSFGLNVPMPRTMQFEKFPTYSTPYPLSFSSNVNCASSKSDPLAPAGRTCRLGHA